MLKILVVSPQLDIYRASFVLPQAKGATIYQSDSTQHSYAEAIQLIQTHAPQVVIFEGGEEVAEVMVKLSELKLVDGRFFALISSRAIDDSLLKNMRSLGICSIFKLPITAFIWGQLCGSVQQKKKVA